MGEKEAIFLKKLLCIVFSLSLILPSLGLAEIDLSSLSFNDLINLRQQVDQELITRPEWKEVTVPQGVWKVGEDIPAGHWTLQPVSGGYCTLHIGNILDEMGTGIDSSSRYFFVEMLTSPDYNYYREGSDKPSLDIELFDGLYVVVDGGSCVFSPYVGKPALGF